MFMHHQNSPPLVPSPKHMNLVQKLTLCSLKLILILPSSLQVGLSSVLSPSGFFFSYFSFRLCVLLVKYVKL
jgi:hypothetical protein